MKITLLIVFFLSIVSLGIVMAGVYPVALVNNSPIFYRTWEKAQDAAKRFSNAEATQGGGTPINFSSPKNSNLVKEIQKNTLTRLIENKILAEKGETIVDGFEVLSKERVADVLRQNPDIKKAAEAVYGLNMQDFKQLVLMPQARIDTANEIFSEKGASFDAWFVQAKKDTSVKLMFTSFRWTGEVAE